MKVILILLLMLIANLSLFPKSNKIIKDIETKVCYKIIYDYFYNEDEQRWEETIGALQPVKCPEDVTKIEEFTTIKD